MKTLQQIVKTRLAELSSLSLGYQKQARVHANQRFFSNLLGDIETCLGAGGGKLYQMGFRTSRARSTLADANESLDWQIYANFAQVFDRHRSPALCPRSHRH